MVNFIKLLIIHCIKNWTQNNTYLNSVITNQVGGGYVFGVMLQLKSQLCLAKVFCIILYFMLIFLFNESYQYKTQLNSIQQVCYKIKDEN
jgi:DMSO reductase anchor subunit